MVGTNEAGASKNLHTKQSAQARASPVASNSNDAFVGDSYSPALFKSIASVFLREVGYSPPVSFKTSDIVDTQTYRTLYTDLSVFNDDQKFFEATCMTAAVIAELSYIHHSPEVKLHIAKYSWFLVYLDDRAGKILPQVQAFQEDVFRHRHPQNAILQGFQENLAGMYNWWDPIAASCITVSALDYVTGVLMEQDPVHQAMEISTAALTWPYTLRRLTGSAVAYAYMLFPKALCPAAPVYVQVIEDIAYIINLLNDLLSYHKEALGGERNNYIHVRARVTGKTVLAILQECVDDLLAANTRIVKVLQSGDPERVETWEHFLRGYTDFHFCSPRYHLGELDFQLAGE